MPAIYFHPGVANELCTVNLDIFVFRSFPRIRFNNNFGLLFTKAKDTLYKFGIIMMTKETAISTVTESKTKEAATCIAYIIG